jgi:Tol biopolymer transport system component
LIFQLLLVGAAAGATLQVSGQHTGNCQAPTWAPDGVRLTYEVNAHTDRQVALFLMEPGHPPSQVRPASSKRGGSALSAGFASAGQDDGVSHEVAWGPTEMGRFIFAGASRGIDQDLFLQGGKALAPAPGPDGGPAWSKDGRWIVFTSARTGQGDLYRLDAWRLEEPPVRLTRTADVSEVYAAISPNGRRVAYTAHTQSGDNLAVIDDVAAPSLPHALTDWPGAQTRPSWSPDGQRLAFYANHEQHERWDLMVLEADHSVRVMARGVVLNHRGPSWTPSGKALVYVLDDDDRFDPVMLAPLDKLAKPRALYTDTVGNEDLDVALGTDGRTWLAVAAQGRTGDSVRDFRNIYVVVIEP